MTRVALEAGRPLAPWRGLRSMALRFVEIPEREARFDARGFTAPDGRRRAALEAVGLAFIGGYNGALQAGSLEAIAALVAAVPAEHRGFAAEGAAMGTAIADALALRRARLPGLIQLLDADFTYLAHVGAGWAMARVPWRRKRLLRPLDPVHHWLAFDGLGFHDGYFMHRKVLAGWRRQRGGYAARAYDQGVGRALWFVTGGAAARAARLIEALPPERRSDLWSGLGLAMGYAGPTETADIARALDLAGRECASLAQGAAFACEARARAGHVPAHTEAAAQALGAASAEELSALVRKARAALRPVPGEEPYEVWRSAVRAALASRLGLSAATGRMP